MFESLFRFLFKYPPLFFEQGDFVFGVSRPMMVAIAVAGLVGGLRTAQLSQRREEPRPRPRRSSSRSAGGPRGDLVFCLLRPALILKAAVPQQNFLGVLVDDSRSMQIADSRRPAAQRVRRRQARGRSPAAERALEEVRPALLPVLLDRRSAASRQPT